MNFVRGALSDADVLLYVTDTVERDDERAAEIIDRIRQSGVPTLVVVNKIDLTTQGGARSARREVARDARRRNHTDLGQGKDSTSPACSTGFWRAARRRTLSTRRIRSRTRRCVSSPRRSSAKKILRNYDKEIPYSCEIEIEEYRESPASTAFRP